MNNKNMHMKNEMILKAQFFFFFICKKTSINYMNINYKHFLLND